MTRHQYRRTAIRRKSGGFRTYCPCGWSIETQRADDGMRAYNVHVAKASHQHPAFEADNCPICGTSVDILGRGI